MVEHQYNTDIQSMTEPAAAADKDYLGDSAALLIDAA